MFGWAERGKRENQSEYRDTNSILMKRFMSFLRKEKKIKRDALHPFSRYIFFVVSTRLLVARVKKNISFRQNSIKIHKIKAILMQNIECIYNESVINHFTSCKLWQCDDMRRPANKKTNCAFLFFGLCVYWCLLKRRRIFLGEKYVICG